MSRTSHSPCREAREPQPVPAALRPRHVPVRPLTGLAALLGLRQPDRDSSFIHNEWHGVTGITHDSAAVQPGDLYAAVPGSRHHGAEFCGQAAAAGAVAVLTDPAGRDRAIRCGLPVFVVADPRGRLGEVASWVYGDPSGRLLLVGVTGTSGKTSTTYLVESGLRMAGHLTGLVGGVETRVGAVVESSRLTTPEATDLQALFAVMAERKVTAAVMEVSSHALALGRVAGTSFEVAVFTNLSQDHLDFHQDMDSYFAAKAELFTPRYARSAVVNIDDPRGRRLAARAPIPVTTFSAAGRSDADWRAADVRGGADGSTFQVVGPGGVEAVLSALRPVTQGSLRIVLGCGGDRDAAKRPLMGAVAAELADTAIFTSDNPRFEDPLAILHEMLAGVLSVPPRDRAHVIVEPDRAAAIGMAIGGAGKGDVVLIAGKGHERGQYVGDMVIPFDDREAAARALADRARAERAGAVLARDELARDGLARDGLAGPEGV